jgi:hypothetical protein
MKHSFIVLASLLAAAGAQAADLSLDGTFTFQKDRVQIDFSLAATTEVRLWTDSWQSGRNFDPLLSLYAQNGSLVASFDDNDGSVAPGAGYFDAGQTFTPLAAGHYHLVLSASSNDPKGATLASGFTYDGAPPIALVDWNQPGYDINANDQKGGLWRVHLSGVDQAAAVPEPNGVALMLAGLLGLGAWLRSRKVR